jgi:hypothetical protein
MTAGRLIARCALVWACSWSAVANPVATQAALDALFSTNAAQPEGSSRVEPPEGFAGAEASEEQLIQFLAEQRRRGADFNAYRHKGTPLHHAIRSGLEPTAIWLLKNGAEPRLPIKSDSPDTENPDALGVAIRVGAWNVFDALMRLPAYAAMPATTKASRYWPVAMDATDKATALMDRRFPLPRFDSAPVLAQSLLSHSLCTGQIRVVQAMLRGEPSARPIADRRAAALCQVAGPDPSVPQAASITLAEWKAIESRLQWPMLPYAVAQARSEGQVRELLNSGLRLPWDDPIATKQTLWSALNPRRPPLALIRAIPPVALKAALQDEALRRLWFRQIAGWPLEDLAWALAQTDPAQLSRQLPQILSEWDYAAGTRRDAKDAADRFARWALLTRQLVAPLPAVESGTFPYQVPVELWPQWFALGFRVTDSQWASWLLWATPDKLQQAWPAISKYQPAVAQRSLTWLVAPVSVGPIDDPQARQNSYGGGGYWSRDQLQNIQFLHAQGIRVQQPRWLAAAYATPENLRSLDFALKQGLVKLPPPSLRKQVVRTPLQCKPAVSPALRRALAPREGVGATAVARSAEKLLDIEFLQPIAKPGQTSCVWLGTGGEPGGRKYIDDEDFFGGVNRLTPCADGNVQSSLWHEGSRRWTAVKDAPEGNLVAIQVLSSKQTAFVALEVPRGTCGVGPAGIFESRFSGDGGLVLAWRSAGHPVFDALALQCDFTAMRDCLGLVEGTATDDTGFAFNAFVDRFLTADKKAFLGALNRLDRAALKSARDEGLFPQWLDEAAGQVSASSASLADKRRRMAWLLAQRHLLMGLAVPTLESLMQWLPAEDWGPVIESLRCVNPHGLQEIERLSRERKLTALNRRLKVALSIPCEQARF